MKNIRFVYAYEDDRREIKSWREEEGYIVGFDLSDGKVKTFRKDRILRYLDGTESLLLDPYTGPPLRQKKYQDSPPHIIFTGFPKAKKAELEAQATQAGMRVCATVTQDCAYLVAGPNAGPRKLETAKAVGALILDGEQFLSMLETGEIPDEEDELAEFDDELAELDDSEQAGPGTDSGIDPDVVGTIDLANNPPPLPSQGVRHPQKTTGAATKRNVPRTDFKPDKKGCLDALKGCLVLIVFAVVIIIALALVVALFSGEGNVEDSPGTSVVPEASKIVSADEIVLPRGTATDVIQKALAGFGAEITLVDGVLTVKMDDPEVHILSYKHAIRRIGLSRWGARNKSDALSDTPYWDGIMTVRVRNVSGSQGWDFNAGDKIFDEVKDLDGWDLEDYVLERSIVFGD